MLPFRVDPPGRPGLYFRPMASETARRMRILLRAFAGLFLPTPGLFEKIERSASTMQGKGWGATTLPQEVDCCLRLLGRTPRTFIDIGANNGDYTQAVLDRFPDIDCYLFEPAPQNIDILRERFADLSWGPKIQVPVTTLDALFERHGEPAFIKIDVEGW